MNRPIFTSVFAGEMNAYLDYKSNSGCIEKSFYCLLRNFDKYCVQRPFDRPCITRDIADEWTMRRDGEATTTHYSRVNAIKNFFIFLSMNGYEVFVPRDVKFVNTDFQPHIYTGDEVTRYFRAVDAYESNRNRKAVIQIPVLFRLLYCCGTRINETLAIKCQNVDIDNGIIRLIETKNNKERFIVLSPSMGELMRRFASKCFYQLRGTDYIFTSSNNGRYSEDAIYEIHRLMLKMAKIPYIGDGEGPRIHDWRHTFAVNAFKQMVDSGLDMYVALPILSTYLGHKTIFATEKYVRLTMALYPYIGEKFKDKLEAVFGGATDENN